MDVCAALREHGFICEPLIDLSMYEQHGRFLEGTGSLVFDRAHQRAYACTSPRTDAGLAERLCGELGYRLMLFDGRDSNGVPIYHTNVMLSIGEGFTVVCLDAVTEQPARDNLKHALLDSGHALITITLGQMQQFAGNIFSVRSISGETVTLMSTSAYQAFSPSQLACISRHSTILHSPIPTIEACGGGSVRCMLAGIHLPVIAT